jgi:two-component system sensor histidine kinase RegB
MSTSTATHSLRRLQFLRLIEIGGQLAALGVALFWLKLALPITPIVTVIATLAVLTLLTWPRLASPRPVTELELFAQLLVDVAAFSLLLYFSGGATNPFVSVYLLPLSIAAALLSAPYAWATSAITVACYTLLLYFYVPLPGMEHQMSMTTLVGTTLMGSDEHALHVHGAENDQFGMHVIGMWLNFVASAALITFFVQRIAGSLRQRERELAAAREETLRNERIVALGTLAAGTAHELGTPLATVAVVAQDLQEEFANDPELGPQLALIRGQVAQCKAVLQRLVDSVGQLNAEEKREVSLAHYVQEIAERWQLLWPNTPLAVRLGASQAAVRIDSTLEQAVLNLLNNAAQASPTGIELETEIRGGAAVLRILDHGPGPAPEVIAAAGKTFLSDRSQSGMGIGLYLANATIERLGGTVRLYKRSGGGCTEITLPVADANCNE